MESERPSLADIDPQYLLRSVLSAFATIAGGYLIVSVLGSVLFVLSGVESLEALQGQPVAYTVVNGVASVGFIVAAVGYLALRDEWGIVHLRRPTATDAAIVVAGFVALGVLNVGVTMFVSAILAALESLFGVSTEFGQNAVITTGRENPAMFLYMIPVTLLIVGPGEELLFRGVVQGLFRRVVGVVPAILVASALFGLGHYFAISVGNPWTYLFAAGAMGILLGGIYEYTESIAVPAVVHGLWNAAVFTSQWVEATGGVALPF